MMLTVTQMAAKIEVAPSTLKRWYEFYNDLSEEEKDILAKEYEMPLLPNYEIAGTRGDRLWREEDKDILKKFKEWVPPTRAGIFKKFNNKEN